jgi:hypothetical protein
MKSVDFAISYTWSAVFAPRQVLIEFLGIPEGSKATFYTCNLRHG